VLVELALKPCNITRLCANWRLQGDLVRACAALHVEQATSNFRALQVVGQHRALHTCVRLNARFCAFRMTTDKLASGATKRERMGLRSGAGPRSVVCTAE
jgi:hypothetical protein